MMIKTLDIEEREDKIHVFIELRGVDKIHGVPKQRMHLSDVVELLEGKGIRHGACIQDAIIKNWNEYMCQGTWIFEKKVLDKSPEPVIIVEEKSVQPKPVRKRRTRSSTKKVSTEE